VCVEGSTRAEEGLLFGSDSHNIDDADSLDVIADINSTIKRGGRGAFRHAAPVPAAAFTSGNMAAGDGFHRIRCKSGRPDLESEIENIAVASNTTSTHYSSSENSDSVLVFCCGPLSLVRDAERICRKYQIQFHNETFEL
jgi:hypothetical protein